MYQIILFRSLKSIIDFQAVAQKVIHDFTTSDLDLDCLPILLLWEARREWVKLRNMDFKFSETELGDKRPAEPRSAVCMASGSRATGSRFDTRSGHFCFLFR